MSCEACTRRIEIYRRYSQSAVGSAQEREVSSAGSAPALLLLWLGAASVFAGVLLLSSSSTSVKR